MSIADNVRDLATDVLLSVARKLDPHRGLNHSSPDPHRGLNHSSPDPHDGHNHAKHPHAQNHGSAANAAAGSFCVSKGCIRGWKVGFAAVLFLEGLLFGYFALLLRRFGCMSTKGFRKSLHFINSGGGGIFLAAGLLHILPETVEIFKEKGAAHNHAPHFPTPFAIGLATFYLFLLFDRVVFSHHHSHAVDDKSDCSETSRDVDEFEGGYGRRSRGYKNVGSAILEEGREADPEDGDTSSESDLSGIGSKMPNGLTSAAFLTAGMATLGIAAHSLLESVAVGAATRFSSALHIFIAISAHRWATCMALGSKYMKGDLTIAAYTVLVVAFALVAPLGVFIGFAAESLSYIFRGTVFAISAGTFIYVGAFETVADEFVAHPRYLVGKFLTMVAGAALMVVITGILVATKVH